MARLVHIDGAPWVETPLGELWVAMFKLALVNGQVVVAELRILPTGPLPEGGLPARSVLRRVRLSAVDPFRSQARVTLARETGDELSRSSALDNPAAPGWAASETRKRRGPKGRDERALAWIAACYVEAHEAGGNPVEAVAAKLQVTRSRAKDIVRQTRPNLLTPTRPGKAGGVLTPRARELLSSLEVTGIPSAEAFGTATVKKGLPPREETP